MWETRRELIDRIVGEVCAGVAADQKEIAAALTERAFAGMPDEEIRSIPGSLSGACLALFDLARTRQPGHPAVRVMNPERDAHGWESSHTAVTVVTDDMPFLVDSLRSELTRRELTIHVALHPQISVRRDAEGALLELVERGSSDDAVNESFLHFEIDVRTAQAELVELETSILKILADVRTAVEDWPQMRLALHRILSEIEADPPPAAEDDVAEAKEFIRWLEDHHLTLLGFLEYHLVKEDGEEYLRPLGDGGLGLWRKLPLQARARSHAPMAGSTARFVRGIELVAIAKSTQRSTVHRPVQMDVVSIKKFSGGRLVGQYRFLGLFTSVAYSMRASRIPLIRRKVKRVIERAKFLPASHNAKGLRHIVETYPRDELFQTSEEDLYHFALRILSLQLRPRVALLVRRDEAESFVSCMFFVPRDRHSTQLRQLASRILAGVFLGEVIASDSLVADTALARVLIVVKVRPGEIPDVDLAKVEHQLADVSRSWEDRLREALVKAHGEEVGLKTWRRYHDAFSASYVEHTSVDLAVDDLPLIDEARSKSTFTLRLYRTKGSAISRLHLRTFEIAVPAPLSDFLPKLENMNLEVLSEVPFEVFPKDAANPVWIRDFEVVTDSQVDLETVRESFVEAIRHLWRGDVENDSFNRLVLAAGLGYRQVILLRAYGKYLRQIGSAFSEVYMASALADNPAIVESLVELFAAFFDPGRDGDREAEAAALREKIHADLEEVGSADDDRILRRFLNLVEATVRTNHYQAYEPEPGKTAAKPYLALKLDARRIEELPRPVPAYEIFVYSVDVEAVHLRGGKVARGGIRWSDRREDFRTEILGLVKAQMVKNAVIVPVGAKGGFVVKRPPASPSREELTAYGVRCYETMMRGLLDLTDNLVDGEVVPPLRVVRRDEDDPYLVVAADKGTATFSDLANRVAAEYGFWLGDAFASGGSAGYDHKGMGITARGAWESVKRHFRETGRDIQSEAFTAVGVGDMSGDVFGNGMLLSEHTRLVAAFNHLHVFLDPNPDPARSYAERRRLFEMGRSSWTDYDPAALSPGGAVLDRHAKTLKLSREAQQALGLQKAVLTPAELIRAILKAPVDLLWLGGIGTYVKASHESHAQADDRANDDVRLDASELRARVVGEGANLGLTQAARVEHALAGGRLNADFIDNSGGVDCSDHEVNIKIALADAVHTGELSAAQRLALLAEMTGEVAELVLRDNYLQSQSITLSQARGVRVLDEQARLIVDLERSGHLDRRLEGLPTEAELAERREAGRSLTRPEIAVLFASSKIFVYNELLDSQLPDEPLLVEDLVRYFPAAMRERFRAAVEGHRLRRELIATHVTNSMLNRVGASFVPRMAKETGSHVSDIARAYTAARDIFLLRSVWEDIEALDNQVPASLQIEMMLSSIDLVERVTRWLLRHAGWPLKLSELLESYTDDILIVAAQLQDMLPKSRRSRLRRKAKRLRDAGVPHELAERVTELEILHFSCDVARCAAESGVGVERVGKVYFAVGESFGFEWLLRAGSSLAKGTSYQQSAVASLIEDFYSHQAELTKKIVTAFPAERSPKTPAAKLAKAAIGAWSERHREEVERVRHLLADFEAADEMDLAMLSVAERELRRLAAA